MYIKVNIIVYVTVGLNMNFIIEKEICTPIESLICKSQNHGNYVAPKKNVLYQKHFMLSIAFINIINELIYSWIENYKSTYFIIN